jgi:transposase
MMEPDQFRRWILTQKLLAEEVVVCYEAGFLGFVLARWLQEQGIQCLVMAPIRLDEANKRVETDKLNARDIVGRLDRYLAGNDRAMTVCRVPKEQEELARHETRQREQLRDHLNAMEAQGRSLLWEFGYLKQGDRCWWARAEWKAMAGEVNATILKRLERLRVVMLELDKQLRQLEGELAAQAPEALPAPLKQPPLGMGMLSLLILTRELMDWGRFKNRRQVGCFSGLVPSEASTGVSVRRGSVTKVGNPVVRRILVEMAWRMVRYQQKYQGLVGWQNILGNKRAGSRARKKAIVAVARVLSVDLWRLATGQTTAQKLGLVCSSCPNEALN